MALPPCSHSSRIPSTVSPFTSRAWPPQLVPGHSPHQGTQKSLPTLISYSLVTSGSLLASLKGDLKPCSKMILFPKPAWEGLLGSQPKRLVQGERGEI